MIKKSGEGKNVVVGVEGWRLGVGGLLWAS